jgi:hypothetical protein
MPRYEVNIFESTYAMDHPPDDPESPERSIVTIVEASDGHTAVESAWTAWDAKYGVGKRPRASGSKVRRLPLRFG